MMTSAKQQWILPFFMAVFFLFIGSGKVTAQQYAKIKLKNRSFLKGNIVQGFDSSAVILNINGSTSRLPVENIQSIKFRSRWNEEFIHELDDKNVISGSNYHQYEPGFYHAVGIGLLGGNDYTGFSASIINGYRFSRLLQAGIGINYNQYEYITTLPIYAEYRAFPKKLKFAPYFFTQLGYGIRVEDTNPSGFEEYSAKGGLYWGAGVGYQINFYETALAFSFGYSNQTSSTEYGNPQYWGSSTIEYSEVRKMGRMDVKVCLVF